MAKAKKLHDIFTEEQGEKLISLYHDDILAGKIPLELRPFTKLGQSPNIDILRLIAALPVL